MKYTLSCLLLLLLFVGTPSPRGLTAADSADPISADERERMREGFRQQINECDAALALAPGSIAQYSRRGDAHLFLGQAREAVADFEKMIALDPAQDAPHWRLGIAYYFAGDFAKSAAQFAKYHAYDGSDRENGIWKFLAQAKTDGLAKAQADMLVYTHFDREPFPSLYEMFAGKKTPADVFTEIERKKLGGDEHALFFARYYAGLEEELLGHREKALALLREAVAGGGDPESKAHDYMWQAARLHWERLRGP